MLEPPQGGKLILSHMGLEFVGLRRRHFEPHCSWDYDFEFGAELRALWPDSSAQRREHERRPRSDIGRGGLFGR